MQENEVLGQIPQLNVDDLDILVRFDQNEAVTVLLGSDQVKQIIEAHVKQYGAFMLRINIMSNDVILYGISKADVTKTA